ncbi:MAG: sigma-70 family RNA polymerase sigma factor [Phycisphaerales bacterium]|nr:sigma-70 family RNA polymerase sigma factor [Phycisphaerales bacterium]
MTDTDLFRMLAAGDRSAFDLVHQRFSGLVARQVHRAIGHRGDIDDACQNAWVLIWRTAHRFDPTRGSAAAWISMLARRAAIDSLRARPRWVLASTMSEDGGPDAYAPPTPAKSGGESTETSSSLRRAFDRLPQAQQTVLSLACSHGLSARQIAEAQGLPLHLVHRLTARGLHRLRGMIDAATIAAA